MNESKKKKIVFQICYQKRFSQAIIFLKKKILEQEKKY